MSERAHIPIGEKRDRDTAITRHLVQLCSQYGWESVAAYVPTASEPGGQWLEPLALELRELWLPQALDDHTLRWGRYEGPDSLVSGAFGILEPRTTMPLPGHIQALVVPAVAVDILGRRLGKGGGYYDRALAGCQLPTIGVVYANEVRAIPIEEHDCRVHMIVTEHGNQILSAHV